MDAMFLNIFVLLPLILVVLVINYFVAREFYKAASAKGWNQIKYFWLPFLLGPAGYLLVIALPDRGGQHMSALISRDLPEL